MIDYENKHTLRVIHTARTQEAINEAARAGFFPLMKKVEPSPKIQTKYAVSQDPETGEISVASDFRSARGMELAIQFTYYYPYTFPRPYAAYLIPADLQVGEKVMLEDLIEDIVGQRWNQGDVVRLASCEAEWDGKDFIIEHDESEFYDMIG